MKYMPPMEGHGGPRVKNGPSLAGQGAQAVRDAITQAIGTLPEQQTLGLNERRLTRAKVVYTGQHLVPDRSHNAVPDC